jgi:hypothetical protein
MMMFFLIKTNRALGHWNIFNASSFAHGRSWTSSSLARVFGCWVIFGGGHIDPKSNLF